MQISAGSSITLTDGESVMTIRLTTDPWVANASSWKCSELNMKGRWAKSARSAGTVGAAVAGYWYTTQLAIGGFGNMLHLVDLAGKPVLMLNLEGNAANQGRGILFNGGSPGKGTKIRGFTDIPEYAWKNLWWGIGFKCGGQLAFLGTESTAVCLINVAQGKVCNLVLQGFRPGIGLGGSAGFTGVIAFNFPTPESMLGYESSGLDFTVNLAEKWMTVLKGMEKFPKGIELLRTMPGIVSKLQEVETIASRLNHVESLTNWAKILASFSGADPTEKGITAFDVPFAGKGLELSLVYTTSTVTQVNGIDAPTAQQAVVKQGSHAQNTHPGMRPRGRDY